MWHFYSGSTEFVSPDNWSPRRSLTNQHTRVQRAVRQARFPFLKTIEEFDFSLQSSLRLPLLGSYLAPELATGGLRNPHQGYEPRRTLPAACRATGQEARHRRQRPSDTHHRLLPHQATKRGIVVVAGNAGADMKAGTLGHVLKQAGMNEDKMESGDAAN